MLDNFVEVLVLSSVDFVLSAAEASSGAFADYRCYAPVVTPAAVWVPEDSALAVVAVAVVVAFEALEKVSE